jgi:hypothetical protein
VAAAAAAAVARRIAAAAAARAGQRVRPHARVADGRVVGEARSGGNSAAVAKVRPGERDVQVQVHGT